MWKRTLELNRSWPVDNAGFHRLKRLADPSYVEGTDGLASEYPVLNAVLLYNAGLKEACSGRRLCVTSGAGMGLVLEGMRVRDAVFVVWALQVPYVLRRCKEKGQSVEMKEGSREHEIATSARQGDFEEVVEAEMYQIVGECYVHGAVDGEKMRVGIGRSKACTIV